jgi:integrase
MLRHTSGLHYTIVQFGFDANRPNVPVIITDEGGGCVLFEAFYFITRIPFRDKSQTWQREAVRAIARLYDFYRVVLPQGGIDSEPIAGTLISKFIESQKYGSSWLEELDGTGIHWDAVQPTALAKIKNYLSKFLETVAEVRPSHLSNAGFNSFALSALMTIEARRREGDRKALLYHLTETSRRDRLERHSFPSHTSQDKNRTRAKHFPFEAIGDLILEGCRRKRRRSEYAGFASEYNLTILMAILLCAGAGLRSSEIFHMFVRDVTSKSVRLYHPAHGRIAYKERYISRQQFLREEFGRLPRTKVSGAQFAGFKSMLMTENDASGAYSIAHFLPDSLYGIPFQEWFYSVFQAYIFDVFPERADHPYLFVSTNSSNFFGNPWTKTAMRDAFGRAVRKIGLVPDRSTGVHPHGLRHLYGQSLKSMNVSPSLIQTCMHHKTIAAQLAYTSSNAAEVNRELTALEDSLKTGVPYLPGKADRTFFSEQLSVPPKNFSSLGKIG